jgi:hypothetical protein
MTTGEWTIRVVYGGVEMALFGVGYGRLFCFRNMLSQETGSELAVARCMPLIGCATLGGPPVRWDQPEYPSIGLATW